MSLREKSGATGRPLGFSCRRGRPLGFSRGALAVSARVAAIFCSAEDCGAADEVADPGACPLAGVGPAAAAGGLEFSEAGPAGAGPPALVGFSPAFWRASTTSSLAPSSWNFFARSGFIRKSVPRCLISAIIFWADAPPIRSSVTSSLVKGRSRARAASGAKPRRIKRLKPAARLLFINEKVLSCQLVASRQLKRKPSHSEPKQGIPLPH